MESSTRSDGVALLPPPSVETSFSSSSGSSSVEGSTPSEASSKISPGCSPAHLQNQINHHRSGGTPRPKSMIPKIQLHLPPRSSMSPAQQNNRPSSASANNSRNRLSLGSKPISLREIRSSSVGTNSGPSINSKESNTISSEETGTVTETVKMRRHLKTSSSQSQSAGHVRSSSLSNGRDRLSLYAPSLTTSSSGGSAADEVDGSRSDLMTHSLIMAGAPNVNSERLARNRKPLLLKSAEKKARKVRFYRNGDRFFKGVTLAISAERYRTFDALLSELNRLVGDRVNLHQGVRVIYNVEGDKISGIEDIQDGDSYVCASGEPFKRLEYTKLCDPSSTAAMRRSRITYGQGAICREAPMISGLDHWKERRRKNQANNNPNGPSNLQPAGEGISSPRWTDQMMKPRLITIIRNGSRPRKAVRLLLNKKTAFTFEQVLSDITEAIRPDTGAVRKLYTSDGRQVTNLADFFGPDFIFIAYGNEKFSHDDFDLTSNEVKCLPPFASRSPMNSRRSKNGVPPSASKSGGSPLSQHRVSGQNGRPSGNGCDGSPRPSTDQSSSLPRVYEDPDELAASNQMVVDVPIVVEIRYEIGRIIGDGNFAVVREGVDRRTKNRFALKLIDKKRCQGKEVVLESEVQVLSRLRHPNVVKLYDVIDANSILCLVLELVEGGDLFDAIAAAGKFSEPEAKRMTSDLASALTYLHSLNIVHRDVKPENLFVVNLPDGMRSLKLGDFGLAEETHEPLYTVCGTPTYVAPEILLETGYGLKVDVWAMGVILFILLCGYPPFVSPTNDQEELFEIILSGQFEFASPYWDDASRPAKDLIALMLQTDPELRYSAAEVLQHPWSTDEDEVEDDSEWEDRRNSHLGLHFDTSNGSVPMLHPGKAESSRGSGSGLSSASQPVTSSKKATKSLITAESTPCLHSLQVL